MAPTPINTLYHADCLRVLERLDDDLVTLAYIDPIWFVEGNKKHKAENNDDLKIYLDFIAKVSQQIKRVLSSKGIVFFHFESSLIGNIRIILDNIFGRLNFRSDIILPLSINRTSSFPINHETILVYTKNSDFIYNPPIRPLNKDEIARYSYSDDRGLFTLLDLTSHVINPTRIYSWHGITPPNGRSWKFSLEKMNEFDKQGKIFYTPASSFPKMKRYLSDSPGIEIGNIWSDVNPYAQLSEKTGFFSQRSLKLLERIIQVASEEGDVILDPFCGSGTTLIAAQKLDRKWIGIDSLPEAISITESRIKEKSIDFNKFDDDQVAQLPIKNRLYLSIETGLKTPVRVQFRLGELVSIDEDLHHEFKEIKGAKAINSIKSNADEYAVAFLNGNGGSIFWGINDDGVVSGVNIKSNERDDIRKTIFNKLSNIQPCLSLGLFGLEFHSVMGGDDIFIIELSVPKVQTKDLYFTGSYECFIKVNGSKRKIQGPQIQQEIIKRFNLVE